MDIYVNGNHIVLDLDKLRNELLQNNWMLACISRTGEMVIDHELFEVNHNRREVWQVKACQAPEAGNFTIAGVVFEFRRSIKLRG